jgi:calcineurin-like phosphoesterase family protein
VAVYFTSDHHFGHAAARSFYRRPFTSIDEMDRMMIDRWNAVVGIRDELWHLGDFSVRQSPERVSALLRVLNGQKHLVTGNNDDATVTTNDGWQSVQPYAEVTVDGTRLVLCHYPFRTWRDMGRGAINLHGHSHGKLKPLPHGRANSAGGHHRTHRRSGRSHRLAHPRGRQPAQLPCRRPRAKHWAPKLAHRSPH